MDFSELDAAIDAQLRHDIGSLLEQSGGELLSIAVLLVDDITGFSTVGLSLAAAAKIKPKRRYRWWSPTEWKLFPAAMSTGADRVTAALWAHTGTLSEHGEVDEDTYELIREGYEEHLVAALARLRTEGLVRDSHDREIWAWVHYADDYDDSVDLRTFRQLNEPATATEFAHRFEDVRTGTTNGALDDVVLARVAESASGARGHIARPHPDAASTATR